MTAELTPSNHRPLEHALADVLAPLRTLDPAAIEAVWDAWRCPTPLLPFLAYALSVDLWDDGWDEVRKRRAIAQSPDYHRRKGTRAAVEAAAGFTERPVTLIEWQDFIPEGRRGTFSVTVHPRTGEASVPQGDIALLRRLVAAAKPKSRAFFLSSGHRVDQAVQLGVGLMASSGAMLMVPPDELEIDFNPLVWLRPEAGVPLEVS